MNESDSRPEHRRDGQFCRLCFNQTVDLCPLFPSATIPNKALLHKIFDCTTITLSIRDDHDANICANCIVSIEAFFKYKSKCVENDRLLRKKRVSFFAGLGLAADPGDPVTILSHSKRRRLSRNEDNGELQANEDEELAVDRKRHRTAGLVEEEDDGSSSVKKPQNGTAADEDEHDEADEEANLSKQHLAPYQIKQEAIDADGDDDRKQHQQQYEPDDDEEEYFNPNQFLAQETKIDEGAVGDEIGNDVSSDGEGYGPNGSEDGPATTGHPFERGWKTIEFAPQPGSSGLKTLKITDYSNVTGKRGRPQRFMAEMLSMAAGSNNLLPYHHGETVYQQLQRLNGLASGARLQPDEVARLPLGAVSSAQSNSTPRSIGGVIEPTKKVQKFLDDGLRELIYNAGAPNPHYARDGGSTDFKVVKARFNSYNIIFDDNRFLRRNKSVSGLPKWYWACSVTGCPVKICSYAGRLFKTNELSHTHPPTEPDADIKYETIQPDPVEAEQLQRQLLHQQQQQHQMQQQRLLRQQQQQQLLRQRQVELAQRRVAAAAALMAAAAANASRSDLQEPEQKHMVDNGRTMGESVDPRKSYELRMANDGSEMLLYAGHTHGLIMTRKDGVRVYKCTSMVGGEEAAADRPCTDTIFMHADGRIVKVCREEHVDYDMELSGDVADHGSRLGASSTVAEEDDKRRRPQKIIVYEGYRYKYCHARPEGSFYWRCVLRHDKDCLASIQTKRNLEFLNVNDQPHNHDPPDPSEPHENAMLCEIRLPVKGEPVEGSTDFKLVKSGQKREFLIYKGYRYYFQYESKNGRRSYRCTMFKNCPAGAFLLPNSTIQEAKNFIHTHPPVEDMDKYITKDSLITSPIKHPSDGAGMNGAAKRPALDASDWKHALVTAAGGGGNIGAGGVEPLSKDPEVARRNGYRIIKNYKNKEIMIYLGWRYFEDYKKKSGGQVWRCSSHRLCRGSVHLFPDGSINFAKLVDHNHSPPKKIISHSSVDGGGGFTKGVLDGNPQQLSIVAEGNGDSLLGGGGTYHRYITHQGHRFRFATRKREGTIYWRCAMRLETKCPVSFHTKEDTYELVSTRNHEHNHPIPTVWPEVAGGQINEPLPKVRMPAEEIGTSDFILTKNSKGRDLVLYRNGRFYLDYSRKDGKIVFRCSAVSGCRATVLLLPNKTLQVADDFSHNHPTLDGWDGGETTVLDCKPAPPVGEPIELKSDEEEDDEPASVSGTHPRASGETMLPKIILYDGFQFRFISRHPTERSAFFRCFNFDAKKNQCHASLYTDLNGVVIQTNQQRHNHEQGDYLMGPDKYHQRQHQQSAPSTGQQMNSNELIGTHDYKIVKNWKNRDVLVFQNCRYFLHYVRKDGRKVWRCSAIRSCHAAVYLNADGTVDQFRGQHVHEIRPEGEPRRRRRRKKSELMFPYGVGSGASMFGNGMLANAAELMARGVSINGSSSLNGGNAIGIAGNGAINGGPHNGNGMGSNEWIDYSDYGIQMSGSSNDTGVSGESANHRANEENHSLWDQFHPGPGVTAGGGANEGEGFDLSYHSVFGSQESFNTYAVHALAQHHLQQQQQQQQRSVANLRQQLHHQHQLLLNGGGQLQQQRASTRQDSSDLEEYDLSGPASGDEHPSLVDITPEVKIEGDDL
uniref:Zf-AD domain-containing protein n=1 Tax=Anopheles funestus TaxID=62324 RepID=A0A182R5M9_ANOFN